MPVLALTYCPQCGRELENREIEGRTRRYCRSCDRPVYRNPKPAAGVLVVDGDRVLLVKRTNPPAVGSWSVPAGYLEVDEPPREAAVRELREETDVAASPADLELVDTTFVDADGQSVLVVVYAVSRSATTGTPEAGSDAAGAKFWSPGDLLAADAPRAADADATHEPGYGPVFEAAIDAISR